MGRCYTVQSAVYCSSWTISNALTSTKCGIISTLPLCSLTTFAWLTNSTFAGPSPVTIHLEVDGANWLPFCVALNNPWLDIRSIESEYGVAVETWAVTQKEEPPVGYSTLSSQTPEVERGVHVWLQCKTPTGNYQKGAVSRVDLLQCCVPLVLDLKTYIFQWVPLVHNIES